MVVVDDLDLLRGEHPGVVAGLGTFDGVHLGHQEVLRQVLRQAREAGGTAAVFTFTRHPLVVLNPPKAPKLITPLPLKRAILERSGIDLLVTATFDRAMADLSPRDFVKQVLVDRLAVRALCVGYDFAFGRGRTGTTETLAALAREHGFALTVVPAVTLDGLLVSSTTIRGLLVEGEVRQAWRLLGRPYMISGVVARGSGRGRTLGYPTANLDAPADLLAPDGVYAARAAVRGQVREAMVNIGVAPTFGGTARRLEVHLPGWTKDLYGEAVTVLFLERLRAEARFPSPEALVAQLERDRAEARRAWEATASFPWGDWALHP